jgi:hypothetical protein
MWRLRTRILSFVCPSVTYYQQLKRLSNYYETRYRGSLQNFDEHVVFLANLVSGSHALLQSVTIF